MANIKTRVYLYDSSVYSEDMPTVDWYKGTEYTDYVLLGNSNTDNLDDTLDVSSLTLVGLPFQDEFAPETKFIIDVCQDQTNEDGTTSEVIVETFHHCVDTDTVEKPILSNDSYYNHNITFIEAAVMAQKRLCDNIAVTYRLKDVTLNIAPSYNVTDTIQLNQSDTSMALSQNFGRTGGFGWKKTIFGHNFKWVMPTWYTVDLGGANTNVVPDWSYWEAIKQNVVIPDGSTSTTIKLPIPMLECWCGVKNTQTFAKNGCCSIDIIVSRKAFSSPTSEEIVQQLTINPSSQPTTPNWGENWQPDNFAYSIASKTYGIIQDKVTYHLGGIDTGIDNDSMVAQSENFNALNRVLTLTIESGYSYSIIIKRHAFDYDTYKTYVGNQFVLGDHYSAYPCVYAYSENSGAFFWQSIQTDFNNVTNDNYPLVTTQINGVAEEETVSIFTQSALPATALQLFNKSQLTTQKVQKINGIAIDNTPTTFYLEDTDKQRLDNTQIVESFYQQKNLWEIFMEVGKYIHSRPKVLFGKDERFVLNWKEYGKTEQYTDQATAVSVYNSRFVEEYVCSCASYIANMVQLGGSITEKIAPKSSSDDYLVYNDVAELIVQKNIIEILSVSATNSSGVTQDITPYVYEESVYNILPVQASRSANKGLAIYYTLGTNKIVGLNYQLPSINTGGGDTDYAIKRILGTAFGIAVNLWSTIIANEYTFTVSYRTKDTLRSDQSRPDLRKYLLSSKYDNVPLHNQFNNQTDTVVDSVKFGNNIYGKLIRTGNKVYTKLEWVGDLRQLKHSGELYNVDGDLYYVSKVKNTYFSDHIESEVEFTKDFNRLSQIIGIPSEPRFYEISEQSLIRREVAYNDYLILDTDLSKIITAPTRNQYIFLYIDQLCFQSGTAFYPAYALTAFKNDRNKITAPNNELYLTQVLTPVCTYSVENTLTVEWDMVDNFSAGDQVGETVNTVSTTDNAYRTLIPYRYSDIYGRCDLYDFAIFAQAPTLTASQIRALPACPETVVFDDYGMSSTNSQESLVSNTSGVALLKDNREALSFNYNLTMLTGSDRFVLSSYLWQEKTNFLQFALLNTEVNKLSNGTIAYNDILAVSTWSVSTITRGDWLTIGVKNSLSLDTSYANIRQLQPKSIAIIGTSDVNGNLNAGATYFVMARNIGDLIAQGTDEAIDEAFEDWQIGQFNKNACPKQ